VHVPVHAEPVELVCGTLDRLAGLDYPRFEVVVVDNNTTDEALCRPVEEHCRSLGSRFRFLHVEGLEGAKAGALNYALGHTAPDARASTGEKEAEGEARLLACRPRHLRGRGSNGHVRASSRAVRSRVTSFRFSILGSIFVERGFCPASTTWSGATVNLRSPRGCRRSEAVVGSPDVPWLRVARSRRRLVCVRVRIRWA
jgi:hypothetical protein